MGKGSGTVSVTSEPGKLVTITAPGVCSEDLKIDKIDDDYMIVSGTTGAYAINEPIMLPSSADIQNASLQSINGNVTVNVPKNETDIKAGTSSEQISEQISEPVPSELAIDAMQGHAHGKGKGGCGKGKGGYGKGKGGCSKGKGGFGKGGYRKGCGKSSICKGKGSGHCHDLLGHHGRGKGKGKGIGGKGKGLGGKSNCGGRGHGHGCYGRDDRGRGPYSETHETLKDSNESELADQIDGIRALSLRALLPAPLGSSSS